jgi:hypothetical protein
MGDAFLVRRVQASENPTSASILQDHDAFNAHENEISGRQSHVTAMPATSAVGERRSSDRVFRRLLFRPGISVSSSLLAATMIQKSSLGENRGLFQRR